MEIFLIIVLAILDSLTLDLLMSWYGGSIGLAKTYTMFEYKKSTSL